MVRSYFTEKRLCITHNSFGRKQSIWSAFSGPKSSYDYLGNSLPHREQTRQCVRKYDTANTPPSRSLYGPASSSSASLNHPHQETKRIQSGGRALYRKSFNLTRTCSHHVGWPGDSFLSVSLPRFPAGSLQFGPMCSTKYCKGFYSDTRSGNTSLLLYVLYLC